MIEGPPYGGPSPSSRGAGYIIRYLHVRIRSPVLVPETCRAGGFLLDKTRIEKLLERHWEFAGSNQDIAHEMYHEDAILEFPQSGERFVGKEKFKAFRERYPAKLDFKIRRITGFAHLWVAENLISYDGAPWMFTVSILLLRDNKVEKEYLYIMDSFEAPDWRAPFRETFDALASLD